MKYLAMIFMAILLIFAFNYVIPGSSHVAADDDWTENSEQYMRGHEAQDSPYKEIGKTVGWGVVIAMGTSGIIFPLRRSVKAVNKNFPGAKNLVISGSKFFGKYHMVFGMIALALSIIHGIIMYVSEGELGSEGMTGLASAALLVIASIFGFILNKNKKVKLLRTIHTIVIVFAILIGLVHIFAS